MSIQKVSLSEKFEQIKDHWNPHIVGELNNQHIKLVKAKGIFDWHSHDNEDEMFFVVNGQFEMHLRNEIILIKKGEFIEHCR